MLKGHMLGKTNRHFRRNWRRMPHRASLLLSGLETPVPTEPYHAERNRFILGRYAKVACEQVFRCDCKIGVWLRCHRRELAILPFRDGLWIPSLEAEKSGMVLKPIRLGP